MADIRATIDRQEIARGRFGDLFEPKLLRILALEVFLAVFQQWCGINVIFNCAQEVFAGAGWLAIIYGILGLGYHAQSQGVHMLILVVSAIACYTMTLAPVTWVIISEIFPNRIRGAAMAIAVFSLWVGCTLLTVSFPFLKRYMGAHGAFWLYGAICAVGFAVIKLRLPETKGKSLEQIERELMD